MTTSKGGLVAQEPASHGSDARAADSIKSHSTPSSCRHPTDRDQLSSQDFVQLTRISRKKQDIERHIASLQSWPAWDPFRDVSAYSADLDTLNRCESTLDSVVDELRKRQTECNRLEQDVQQFNLEDMDRLRSVAKAVSKRHLSGSDTDLLELALETVFTLDKLLRLLRERRREHDLTELRLRWERVICSAWFDVVDLRRDIAAFERKCKSLSISRSSSNGPLARGMAPTQTRKHENTSTDNQNEQSKQQIPRSTSSSSRLASESLKLETARLVLRIRSFDTEKVRPAGRLLDLLIDQRQVPEKLIDEQEKLEDALPQPSAIEAKSSQTLSALGQPLVPTSQKDDAERSESVPAVLEDSADVVAADVVGSTSHAGVIVGSPSMTQPESQIVSRQDTPKTPQTKERIRKISSSSMLATPVRRIGNPYRSDPCDALDVAIGDIVNRMPISVPIKNAGLSSFGASQRSSMFQDLSGQYWIGDPEPRLCFCRILPSNMVMVRVGGGWQELSEFLMQHFAHLSLGGPPSQTQLNGSDGSQASHLTSIRSASGPVGSPRLRTRSSVGLLRSTDAVRHGTPQKASRIFTMPSMRTSSILTPAHKPTLLGISSLAPQRVPLGHRDASSSTPCKTSSIASSGSDSSIVLHSSSPRT